jgi:predicted DNA-binding transcriptional regulator AlpA
VNVLEKVQPDRRYIPLGHGSIATLKNFREQPESLFGAHDVAAAGLFGSRPSLWRAVRAKRFPAPVRLPTGRLAWRGAILVEWYDQLERAAGLREDGDAAA